MQCQRVVLALLLMLSVSPLMAADGAPGRGLKEIPDPELNLMRGRYTVGGNNVAWFGVTMISQWQGPNGAVVQGALTLGMDFRNGGTPKLSFQPSVHVTAADAPLPTTTGRSIDSAGLANASGLVQSVQVAGDGNTARNVTTLTVRDGAVPTAMTDDGSRMAQAQQGGATATAMLDGNQARLLLQVDGQSLVQQWIRNGSVGQGIALAGDGQTASNRLQLELVRNTAANNLPLSQNVAQAIGMNRGMGPGQ
ncbi:MULTISPECIES: hypothetical protein [Stenotrophomonas]|uniref:hypothetical protein n=1 Tax=Stenotrophomonas TaxID=40323 RepID=UPI000D3799D3|nr:MULTISPECIES: hypothetical protein [Stenotrophomonas]PTT40352.1 hypothetical protein DBR33_14545 [Stenotrophomonas sp. HMWF022]PTS72066.1 hypothetical protein DBR20_19955 [Stenotrophomonas sp. HMWF023]CAH0161990.1 hypothetical protein SRABI122_00961 [Stenotrophomonas lactitubi]CAH0175127.1 hypothetical protein SRABI102_01127 [Stenotrophomonas lactitubi]CAH0184939.1 hypothetical protein SRABI81_01558 [Stenotrophomonas lactitubi]